MPVDASIISEIPSLSGDPASSVAKVYTLKGMVDENQLNQLKLGEAKQTADDDQKTRQILAKSNISTPEGLMKASESLNKAGLAGPAMDLLKTAQQGQKQQAELSEAHIKILEASQNILGPAAIGIKQTLTTNPAMARAQYAQKVAEILPLLPPEMVAKIPAQPPQDDRQFSQLLDTTIGTSASARKMLAQQMAGKKEELSERAETTRERAESERERHDITQEKANSPTAVSVENTAQMIANGQMPMLTGFSLKTPWGQAVVSRVREIDPEYEYGEAPAKAATLRAFTSGSQGNTVRSLNVAISHLGTLSDLATGLHNNDIQLVNRASNAWKTQTGSPAPTNFTSARDIVANEIVKAVTSSGGTLADREEAQKQIQAAASPQQLTGVIKTWKQLLSGQLGGLRQQYEQGTGQKDFERFLSEDVKNQLETSAKAPSGQPKAGDVVQGYKFKGGDPSKKASWEKVSGG